MMHDDESSQTGFLQAVVEGSLVADELIELTDFAFAYCEFDEECPWGRVLRIGKTPLKLSVTTAVDASLIGQEVDCSFEILDRSNQTIWDVYWSTKILYANQLSMILFKQLPDELKKLKPGIYIGYATVITVAGEFGELQKAFRAV